MLLIVVCTGALQFVSQDRAYRLRAESVALRAAASNTEQAEQLVKAVVQFRLTTHLYLSPERDAQDSAADELTDAAMQIGDRVNALAPTGP